MLLSNTMQHFLVLCNGTFLILSDLFSIMKSGKFCDLCRKEITINNMIPVEIQGENYIFDSYDCVRIFHKLNAVYDNILIGERSY